MTLTPPDRQRLRECAEKATPGPWECERHDEDDSGGSINYEVWNLTQKHYTRVVTINDNLDDANAKANAAFIAAANPQAVLALLDELTAAKAETERAVEMERERCLAIAAKYTGPPVVNPTDIDGWSRHGERMSGLRIATAIRAAKGTER